MSEKIKEKIEKLLNLSMSDNEYEAALSLLRTLKLMNEQKFNYQDIVYYTDNGKDINKATFSEYWENGFSYIKKQGNSFLIETKELFDSEMNLLLHLFKEKIKSINSSKRLIEKLQNDLPILNQELIELEKRISKF